MRLSNQKSAIRNQKSRGLSLVETLIALAITAMLLTATMVATDASFKAYAAAAEQASAQAATRMVTNRLLTLVRTSTAHGPLEADASATPAVTVSGDTVASHYIELLDARGDFLRIEYRVATQELWWTKTPASGAAVQSQPLLGGVTNARFFCHRRQDTNGLWILERGTMDLTVQPGNDGTLSLENGPTQPIRVIASTMPRKLEEE